MTRAAPLEIRAEIARVEARIAPPRADGNDCALVDDLMYLSKLKVSLRATGDRPTASPSDLVARLGAALELEALAEVRERLLSLLEVPGQLFRVHVEVVAGRATQCRASLQLTDPGRNLAAALGARDVDRLIVEEALSHFDLSMGCEQPTMGGRVADGDEGLPPPSATSARVGEAA